MTEPKTYTLEAPGAMLHYDVRANDDSARPVLLIIGSPMGASGFGALAEHFADRTVVTYDPRGAERSKRTDGVLETTVAGPWPWPNGSRPRRWPSPAATADSSRATVLTAANRAPSPASCARSSPTDGPRGLRQALTSAIQR